MANFKAATETPDAVEHHGAKLRAAYAGPALEYAAATRAAGLFDHAYRSMISARGGDRARFIHSMTTNDVQGLAPGHGLYAVLLDVRGHILADLDIYCEEDQLLMAMDLDLVEKALAALGKYNIGGRTALNRLPLSALAVAGPKSSDVLREALGVTPPAPGQFARMTEQGACVIYDYSTGLEGYEIWAAPQELDPMRAALVEKGKPCGLLPCGAQTLEILRIEAGIPKYGSELAEDTLPLEAGIEAGARPAISFNKGCYIGQEIVERTRSRGRVNWKLMGLIVESLAAPPPEEKLMKDGTHVGEITSACVSIGLGKTIALAYLRREAAEPGTRLALASGSGAVVASLPFIVWPERCIP